MKYNILKVLFFILHATCILSNVSIEQAANAIKDNSISIILEYLDQGGDPLAKQHDNGHTLLELAKMGEDKDMINLLSGGYVSIEQAANAIIDNNISILRDYLEQGGDPIAEQFDNGHTLFELAVMGKNINIIDLLLAQKPNFDPNILDYIVGNPHYIKFSQDNYSEENSIEIIRRLILNGPVRVSDDNIIEAVYEPKIIEMLLSPLVGGNVHLEKEIIDHLVQQINFFDENAEKSIKICLDYGADINIMFETIIEYYRSLINENDDYETDILHRILISLIQLDKEIFKGKNFELNVYKYLDLLFEEFNRKQINRIFKGKNIELNMYKYFDLFNQEQINHKKEYIKEVINIFIHEGNINMEKIIIYAIEKHYTFILSILSEMGAIIPLTETKSTQTEFV
ncbi:MAG: hypothetical protein K2X69_05510 [Silvanigrellaceae bacterium]|nr:hypothetical protein [Silvanigrellaceae bacterium]